MSADINKNLGRTDVDTQRILTVPNVISFVRLCMVPWFFWLLYGSDYSIAAVVFALASATDFLDGQIARRTHSVSFVGKLLDPIVDTVLMASGILGACLIGRAPWWIFVIIFVREIFVVLGAAFLLRVKSIHIPVVYAGKIATTLLFVGFVSLLLGWPACGGIGITDSAFFPGFNDMQTYWGIWVVYVGLLLQLATTLYYCQKAITELKHAKAA